MCRAWRIQIATWTAGGRLSFRDAFRLNLYGEAAAMLTPNRLGGEPARFIGLTESGLRPVTALVAIGVEVASEWPVFILMAIGLFAHYVPDWHAAAGAWLHRHRAAELVAVEVVALLVLIVLWGLQKMARSGTIRHRVRRQWRVALAHVRRAPWWAVAAGAVLTAVSFAARAFILAALAIGLPHPPPLAVMFFGSLALIHGPLIVPIPSGGGGVEVAFLSGFAGYFGAGHQVAMLLLWRFYTMLLLTVLGIYVLLRTEGSKVTKELLTVGWFKRSKKPESDQ